MAKIFYITRDVERAVGLMGGTHDVFVITNSSPLARTIVKRYPKHLSLINDQLSTLELMRNTEVKKIVGANSIRPSTLVFKTSPQIEKECEKNGWRLLNPPYRVGAVLEEKIEQWRWLQSVVKESGIWDLELRDAGQSKIQFPASSFQLLLPQVWIGKTLDAKYQELVDTLGDAPIVQFNRGHTGLGTFRLESEQQWEELRLRFPNREVKISRFYEGKTYTVNAIVISQKSKVKSQKSKLWSPLGTISDCKFHILVGHISEQLTGIPGCTNNPYATVGNDWSAGARLSDGIKSRIYACADTIGKALGARGYRGLFGIDVIVTESGEAILLEVNPRQPASAAMEAQLQQERGDVSVMEMHIIALSQKSKVKSQNYGVPSGRFDGFQLFFRNLQPYPVSLKREFAPGRYDITEKGLNFIAPAASPIETTNHEFFAFSVAKSIAVPPGGEVLRIQSKQSIIETLGEKYLSTIQKIQEGIPHQELKT